MFKPNKLTRQIDNFVMARWYHQQHQHLKLNAQEKLWPSSEDLYHPWNPVFADFCQTQDHLSLYSMILLRDGAQSLLDFFLRFPEPSKESSRLIVQADLSFLVPEQWQETTLCYRLKPSRENQLTKKLLFYQLLSDLPMDKNIFSKRLNTFLENFSPDSQVDIFIGMREKLYGSDWSERRDCFEFMAELQYYFQNKVRVIGIEELKKRSSNEELTYVNLDTLKSSVAFCSIDSYMMANSCQLFPQKTNKGFHGDFIERSPLSFNHDLVLYGLKNINCDFNRFKKLKTYAKGTENMPFPIIPELLEILHERLTD